MVILKTPLVTDGWSVKGKTVVITGCTNGIGRETAEALAGMGATVIMACRNLTLAESVAQSIRTRNPAANIIVGPQLDLADQGSVKQFAAAYKAKNWPLHILVNNAGANHYGEPYYTPEGIGGLCQINYLGPYTLTRLLESRLIESAPARVVNVSSIMSRIGRIGDVSKYLTTWKYGSIYANTKLANAVFAFELHQRLAEKGVASCAVDPGGVATSIWEGGIFGKPPFKWVLDAVYAPSTDGATAVLHAITVPWKVDSEKAAAVNIKWSRPGVLTESHEDGGGLQKPVYDKEDLRFYARGLFASPLVTSTLSSSDRDSKNVAKLKRSLWGLSSLVHSVLDYPCRWMSGGMFGTKTIPVPANPLAYDAAVRRGLWDASADAAGVDRECCS